MIVIVGEDIEADRISRGGRQYALAEVDASLILHVTAGEGNRTADANRIEQRGIETNGVRVFAK